MAFPGGYGAMASCGWSSPPSSRRNPKRSPGTRCTASVARRHGEAGFLFRLDESKGDGKGYDQLIVDMNQNGDLTDDAPAPLVALPTDRKTPSRAMRPRLVWPHPGSGRQDDCRRAARLLCPGVCQ